jgi:5-methylthioadenosine/S-adenosylhomocysteine deaminase
MQSVDHIIHARWLISGEPNQPALDHHSLIIKNGIIHDMMNTQAAKETYTSTSIHDYPHHAILPGFINAHTHLGMNFFRGLGCDLPLHDWLQKKIWPAEKKWLSHAFVQDASLFAMAEMIRSGTTCFNDMFYFMPATADAAIQAGLRAFIGIHLIEFANGWANTIDECFAKGFDFYEQYKNQPLITATIAPHAPYTISDDTFLRVHEAAETFNLQINLHLHETMDEINQSMAQTKKRPIKRLHDLGFLSPRVIAIHSVHLNEEDLDILAMTQPHIVHCPESNMKLASGICPVNTLNKMHLNVALGTDSVASNNDLDMLGEMRSATMLSKISTLDATSLNTSETLRLATLNGAKALQIESITGSLIKGKAADFIAIQLNDIESLPLYDPLVQMIYSASRHQVTDVWVAGKQLMKNRMLLTLDEAALKEKAQRWGQLIQQT